MGGWLSHGGEAGKGRYGGSLIQNGNDGEDGVFGGEGARGGQTQNNQEYNNDRNSRGGTGGKGGYGGSFRKSGHSGEDGWSNGRCGKGGKPAISVEQNPNGLDDDVNSASMSSYNRFCNLLSFVKQLGGEKDRNSGKTRKENEVGHTIRNDHHCTDGKLDGLVENHEQPSVLHDQSCNSDQRRRGGKGGKGGYEGPFVKSGHDGEDGSGDGWGGRGGKPAIYATRKHKGQDNDTSLTSMSLLQRVLSYFIFPWQASKQDQSQEKTENSEKTGKEK